MFSFIKRFFERRRVLAVERGQEFCALKRLIDEVFMAKHKKSWRDCNLEKDEHA